MNFNIGEWIVEALKLIKDSKELRRLIYTGVLIFGTPAVIVSIVKLIEVLNK